MWGAAPFACQRASYLRHTVTPALKSRRWPDHFCRALHVAMQFGPYLHSFMSSAPRVVSEGSIASICEDFPADCPHPTDFHQPLVGTAGYTEFPANSGVF